MKLTLRAAERKRVAMEAKGYVYDVRTDLWKRLSDGTYWDNAGQDWTSVVNMV